MRTTAHNTVKECWQSNACLDKYVLSCLWNSVYESVSQSDGGRLFYTKGPVMENARSPNFFVVRTVGINVDKMYYTVSQKTYTFLFFK